MGGLIRKLPGTVSDYAVQHVKGIIPAIIATADWLKRPGQEDQTDLIGKLKQENEKLAKLTEKQRDELIDLKNSLVNKDQFIGKLTDRQQAIKAELNAALDRKDDTIGKLTDTHLAELDKLTEEADARLLRLTQTHHIEIGKLTEEVRAGRLKHQELQAEIDRLTQVATQSTDGVSQA
ncbi:MAG: hypothetical protein HQK60_18915, partial [Deltaproteobacteria bacterium]|nr:hypothetical protein [Deltaproteobacteria bacterium]